MFFDSLITMSTFTDVSIYCEVGGTWLDAASVPDSPLSHSAILKAMEWRFKGGSMGEAAASGSIQVENSGASWPDGMSRDIGSSYAHAVARDWVADHRDATSVAHVAEAQVMKAYLSDRIVGRNKRMTKASLLAHVATYAAVHSTLDDLSILEDKAVIVQGAAAIYEAAEMIVTSARPRNMKASFSADSDLRAFIREMVVVGAIGSSLHAPSADVLVTKVCDILEGTRVAGIMSCWKDVQLAAKDMKSRRRKAETLAFGKDLLDNHANILTDDAMEDARDWVRRSAGVWETSSDVVFHTAQMVSWCKVDSGRILVFGKSAMASLAQTLISYASQVVATVADTYVESQVYSGDPVGRATIVGNLTVDLLNAIYSAGARCSPGNHVKVCKTYKRAFAAYHAMVAGPPAASDVPVLKDLALQVGEVPSIAIEDYWSTLSVLTAKEAHNVGKVFKVCPPPDVSPGSTMLERISDIKNPNVFSARYGAAVLEELKIQVVFARCNMPGPKPDFKDPSRKPKWASSYYRGDWTKVPIDDLPQYVAWEGSLDMPCRSQLDPSIWKDSSVGADTLDDGLSGEFPDRKKNMKTRMLFDVDVPNPELLEVNAEHVVEMLIKGEGHKDPARAIFSSNIRHRFRQSLLELAVERVARHHPSFFVGSGPEEYERVERLITTPGNDPSLLPRYYSFDVSGWSAKMSRDIQLESRKIWSALYSSELFVDNLSEMADAKIYVNKSGYIGWYRNTGSNLEGFDGKHLTMVNVAMLAATVKVWRLEAVAEGLCTKAEAGKVRATLMSYIDDGMAKIDFPATNGQAQATACFAKFQEVALKVFSDASFTLDPPKCFPSDVFFVFLNEVYIAGRRILHGTRAASAICGDPMEEHLSFPECVDKVTNGCRGVVKSGADATAAAVLQAFHLFFLAADWVKLGDPIALTRWMVVPKAMGGLGVPTQLQISSTASGEPMAEGIMLLQLLANATGYDAQLLVELVTAEYESNAAESVLVAPLSIRIAEGYMPVSAMSVAVRKAVEDWADRGGELSRIAMEYLRYADPDALKDYAAMVIPAEGVVQEAYLNAAADSHPQKVFAQFTKSIESSRTLRNIVGFQAYSKIILDNAGQAKASWAIFKRRMAKALERVSRVIV